MAYSKSKDGLYCLSCILFPCGIPSQQRANLLMSAPYQNWKNARADILKHSTLKYHLQSECSRRAFLEAQKGVQLRLDHCLTSEAKSRIAHNRQVLKSVIACLEFCGRQGISLRGHRDYSTSDSLNQGNFKALIQLRIDAGDVSLETHLQTCSKRAT